MTHEQTLSPLDAAFFHVESERTPMHMASIGIFEGGPLYGADGRFRIDDIRAMILSRLKHVPKLRQKACSGLLGQAPPSWIDDPEFEISEHVRVCQLPHPGTEVEFGCLCAERLAVPLDRARPLWELTFVEGLSDRRVAVIEKLHHSMADGIAAAELATVLLDLSPDPQRIEEEEPWVPDAMQPVWRAVLDDLLRLGGLSLRVAAWGGESVLHPLRRLGELTTLGRAISTLATPKILAPKSSLNRPIEASRSVEFVRLPFSQLRDVGHSHDSSVNDVLLTAVAGGLRALLEGRGELTEKSELQALVPVGLVKESSRGLRNSVSAYFVRLPVGVSDPLAVLRVISAESKDSKRRHQELATGAFLRLLEPLPQDVLATVVGTVQHQPFFNLIVTNVPGPPVPLYVLGAKLLEAFPVVPLGGNQSLAVAALSYEGQLNLGILSDPATCPDVEVFCHGVRSTLRALVAASVPAHSA